jgi:preprotein translocase subunit SecY
MSIFSLNIMPYITASIIMQLMSSMSKSLAALKKEGEYGQSKINQYTRYLTILLSLFQALGIYYALSNSSEEMFISDSKIFLYTTVVSLVGGVVMLMWFGERITANGIGNGISLIIFVGIVSSIPATFAQFIDLAKSGVYSPLFIIFFFLSFILFVYFVVYVEKSHKRIKINYPSSAMMRISGVNDSSFLPLKLNITGVIPPIFASSILMFPSIMTQFGDGYSDSFLALFRRGSFLYLTLFASLILFFSFFYSSIIFNTKDVSQNLKKSNCFIFGIRPGEKTALYLDKVIARLTLGGGIYLVLICLIPEILMTEFSIPLHIGGTGILIIVNVILDLIAQIQSHLNPVQQGSATTKRRRVRVRN